MDLANIAWIKGKQLDLFIESFSNAARTVEIRGLTKNEQIIADHVTNADVSLATQTVSITDIPLFLTARTVETSVSRGETYVKVSLRVNQTVVALLFSDYVTDAGAPVFPSGKVESSVNGTGLIRLITGTNPAADTEISEAVPTGALWRLLMFSATLVADANAANRAVSLRFSDGTTEFIILTNDENQLANETRAYHWFVGSRTTASIGGVVNSEIPRKLLLPAGFTIDTFTVSRQVGDNWSAPQFLIEEWIQP